MGRGRRWPSCLPRNHGSDYALKWLRPSQGPNTAVHKDLFFFFPGSHMPQPRPAAGGTCYHQQPSLDKAIHASSRQLQPSEKATKQRTAVSLSVQDHSPWASDGLNNHHSRPAAVCAALGHSWFLSLKAPRRNSSC